MYLLIGSRARASITAMPGRDKMEMTVSPFDNRMLGVSSTGHAVSLVRVRIIEVGMQRIRSLLFEQNIQPDV